MREVTNRRSDIGFVCEVSNRRSDIGFVCEVSNRRSDIGFSFTCRHIDSTSFVVLYVDMSIRHHFVILCVDMSILSNIGGVVWWLVDL